VSLRADLGLLYNFILVFEWTWTWLILIRNVCWRWSDGDVSLLYRAPQIIDVNSPQNCWKIAMEGIDGARKLLVTTYRKMFWNHSLFWHIHTVEVPHSLAFLASTNCPTRHFLTVRPKRDENLQLPSKVLVQFVPGSPLAFGGPGISLWWELGAR
jgi:hypothetical protein